MSQSRETPIRMINELCDMILLQFPDALIILIGNENIPIISNNERIINVIKMLNLRQTMSLINQCDLFICPNSGFMHIAGALHIPMIIMEAAFITKSFIGFGTDYDIIKSPAKLKCMPCRETSCKYDTVLCMDMFEVKPIIEVIKRRRKIGSIETSIIIPMHNNYELTEKCLKAIKKNTPQQHEIIIIDNGSTQGLINGDMSLMDNVRFITNTENLGYSKANNQGARIAIGKYLCFLNNDTEVQPDWLKHLLSRVKEDKVGVVGSKITLPNGTDTRMSEDYICGACMLTPRDVYFKVNGMEERYFAYFDDWDYSLTLKEKGYKVIYEPKSLVHHLVAQTSSKIGGGSEVIGRTSNGIFNAKWKNQPVPVLSGVPFIKSLTTFIVATEKRPIYLSITLNSILLQTDPNWECIIMDEGENESVIPKDPRFRRIKFNKVRYDHTIENRGTLGFLAHDEGLKYANGEFICFPNEDIYYVPTFLDTLKRLPGNVDLRYCDWVHSLSSYTVLDSAPSIGRISVCNYIIRKDVIGNIRFGNWFKEKPSMQEVFVFGMADGYFIEALIKKGISHAKAKGVLMVYN
jgi:GT2 family glycosyltransferase